MKKTCLSFIVLLLLSLQSLASGEQVAIGEVQTFKTFDNFLQHTAAAKVADYKKQIDARVEDETSFQEMQQYIKSFYAGVTAAHSFVTDYGQYVDCVPIAQQPSVKRAGLSEGDIQTTPPVLPQSPEFQEGALSQDSEQNLIAEQIDEFGNNMTCAQGEVPLPRITLDVLSRFRTLTDFFRKHGQDSEFPTVLAPSSAATHYYAHAYQIVNNLGTSSSLNLWNPQVTSNNMSLSQQWVVGGSGSSRQTVEGGWQVYPAKYNTNNACLFIFWTSDNYNQHYCYNTDCAAFVLTNSNWHLGRPFSSYSMSGGPQYDFNMTWYRDPSTGNWWLYLQGGGSQQAIGYYPKSLYGSGQLSQNASAIDFGGEDTGSPGAFQMGSGAYANAGWQYSAYQRNITYFSTSGVQTRPALTPSQSNSDCYTVLGNHDSTWGTYFYFGGSSCYAPSLFIDGVAGSTKQQGETFNVSGSKYTPNSAITRYMTKPDGSKVVLTPTLYTDGSGNISWSFTATCATTLGTSQIWLVDPAKGPSPYVTQTVTASSSCNTPTLFIDGGSTSTKAQGGIFNFTGSNYTVNGTVNRYLKRPDGSTSTLANVIANSSGNVNWSYSSVCADTPGTYQIQAKDSVSGKYSPWVTQVITASPKCTGSVNPVIAQTPMSGPPGTTFSQWGTGFTANSTATLHFRKPDGTEYPTAPQAIKADGTFSITYTAPTSKAPGTYTWWAVDGPTGKYSNTVSYTINVSPVVAQTPMSGPPGTTFSQWGTGFTANSTATLHFRKPDGTEYPTAPQAIDSNGTFSIKYTAPSNKPQGTYKWWGVDGPTGKVSNTVSYSIN